MRGKVPVEQLLFDPEINRTTPKNLVKIRKINKKSKGYI